MTNSFTDVFGGITIYPSDLGFIDYTLTTSSTLIWPDNGESSSNIAASFTRITASNPGIIVTLPDADAASVGKALRFKNNGSNTFTIDSASGSTIATMSAGQDILLSITNNTTSGGLWDSSYIGSGTTSANASVLAGNGLTTSGATLIANWPVNFTGSSGYNLTTTSDATVLTWTGGTGTVNIALDAGTGRNGYIAAVKNYGTGILTLSGNAVDKIDGSTVSLFPNDSTFIVSAGLGNGFYTIGLTNNTSISVIQLNITSSITTLTAAQATNKIFILSGDIANTGGGCSIVFPEASGQFTIINRMTAIGTYRGSNEAYVVIQTSAVGGATVNIPLGSTRTIVSDGTNMYFDDDLSQNRPAQNLLYYCDFSKNPWQRGTSFTSSSVSQYAADRVSMICTSGAKVAVSRVNSTTTGRQYDLRAQFISGQVGGGVFRMGFDLETIESIPLRGSPLTLAAELTFGSTFNNAIATFGVYTSTGTDQKIIDTISNWSLVMQAPTGTLTTNSGYYLLSINPPSYNTTTNIGTTFSQASVLFQYTLASTADPNNYVNISRLALVQGAFSGFDNLEAVDVDTRCRRFAHVWTASAANQTVGIGQAIATGTAGVFLQFPVVMRTAPSLSITASSFYVATSTGIGQTCSSITSPSATKYGTQLSIATVSSNLTAGNATILASSSASASMVFSADL